MSKDSPHDADEPGEALATAPPEQTSPADLEEERWRRHVSNLKTIGAAVILAIFIRIVLFEAFEIDGPSMEPTLLNGDRVVVAKYPFGLFLPFQHEAVTSWGMPNPGDVVIVNSPADGVDIVKRVIGVPGDVVELRGDEVFVNGESIRHRELGPCHEDEELQVWSECVRYEEGIGDRDWIVSYSEPTDERWGGESMPRVRVPEGHIFVMGDHRDHSNDSRNPRVGMIPIGRVKGRALAIYWSNDSFIRWPRIFSAIR